MSCLSAVIADTVGGSVDGEHIWGVASSWFAVSWSLPFRICSLRVWNRVLSRVVCWNFCLDCRFITSGRVW